jgi:chromate transporter
LKYKNRPTVEHVFLGLRPAVVGLLAAACLLLLTPENFSTPSESPWQFWISVAIFIFTLIACQVYKLSPIRTLLFCALVGILLF